jgi:type VI secretion system protein ImpA
MPLSSGQVRAKDRIRARRTAAVGPARNRSLMTSPDILDFAALLAPIAADRPGGEDLRGDPAPGSLYYRIKDARAAARAAERAGGTADPGSAAPAPEWRKVLELAPQLLATKAKDLEVVAWLVEALVREHGFAGLRDGFRLARELVARFWDALHPMPDEDGLATRVAPLAGLGGGAAEGTLAVPIALAPITGDGESGAFGMWHYGKARENGKAAAAGGAEGGGATLEQFVATVRGTDPEFFRTLAADIDAALAHHEALTALLDERCGAEAPSSSAIRNALQDVRQTVAHVMRDIAGIAPAVAAPTAGAAATAPVAAALAAPGALRSRDDAFRLIEQVADWFRANEPHSPLASVLDQAVRWGRLPFRQLIEELIPDAAARDHFGLLTGLGGAARGDAE